MGAKKPSTKTRNRAMIRYAIVTEGRKFFVVRESRIGQRKLVCLYSGPFEAARKLAEGMQQELYHLGRWRLKGKKSAPVIPDE